MADENMTETSNASAASSGGNKTNPMMIGIIAIVVIAVVAGLFFVMGNRNKTGEESMTPVEEVMEEDSMESTGDAMMEDGDVVAVNLEAGSFYFKPNVINAKLGQTVKVTINSVSQQHDFVIEELDVQSPLLPSGQNATVEFVASEVGTFEFYCSVGNHRQQGMVGTLTVTQ